MLPCDRSVVALVPAGRVATIAGAVDPDRGAPGEGRVLSRWRGAVLIGGYARRGPRRSPIAGDRGEPRNAQVIGSDVRVIGYVAQGSFRPGDRPRRARSRAAVRARGRTRHEWSSPTRSKTAGGRSSRPRSPQACRRGTERTNRSPPSTSYQARRRARPAGPRRAATARAASEEPSRRLGGELHAERLDRQGGARVRQEYCARPAARLKREVERNPFMPPLCPAKMRSRSRHICSPSPRPRFQTRGRRSPARGASRPRSPGGERLDPGRGGSRPSGAGRRGGSRAARCAPLPDIRHRLDVRNVGPGLHVVSDSRGLRRVPGRRLEPDRREQPLLDVGRVRRARYPGDDLPEQHEAEVRVVVLVARLEHAAPPRRGARTARRATGRRRLPLGAGLLALQARCVREQVLDGHAAVGKLGDVLGDRRAEVDRTCVAELHHGRRRERLRDRGDAVLRGGASPPGRRRRLRGRRRAARQGSPRTKTAALTLGRRRSAWSVLSQRS